jgi:uncharacterized damage-inducible protein DinB
MNHQTTHINQLLTASYDGEPWHGNSLQTILRGVAPGIAFVKTEPLPYSIANLVAHLTQWRRFVAEKLKGNDDFSIQLNSPEDWPELVVGPHVWEGLLANLAQSQADLAAQLALLPDTRLDELVPSKKIRYTYRDMLMGLVSHDVYHSGQIALLKKLLG